MSDSALPLIVNNQQIMSFIPATSVCSDRPSVPGRVRRPVSNPAIRLQQGEYFRNNIWSLQVIERYFDGDTKSFRSDRFGTKEKPYDSHQREPQQQEDLRRRDGELDTFKRQHDAAFAKELGVKHSASADRRRTAGNQ